MGISGTVATVAASAADAVAPARAEEGESGRITGGQRCSGGSLWFSTGNC